MHPNMVEGSQSVSGPRQNHRGYITPMGLRDMKQHAMGWASLGTMLLLRECAFQEEGQGPRGHKAWLMAEKRFFPSHENQGLQSSPAPPALHCSLLPAAWQRTPLLPPAGEWLPEPGRAVLLHRGKSQPGLSLPHKATSAGCHWRDTGKCRYSGLGLHMRSRKPSEQALHFGCGTWWLHTGKPPCLLCTMPGFHPMPPLQRDKLALG